LVIRHLEHSIYASGDFAGVELHSKPWYAGQPEDLHGLCLTNSVLFEAPNTEFTFTSNTCSSLDSGWGLFDVQPTLDWLDADFSLFANETYQQT